MHCWSQCHHNKYRCRKTVETRRCGVSPKTNRNCDLPLTRLAPSLRCSSVWFLSGSCAVRIQIGKRFSFKISVLFFGPSEPGLRWLKADHPPPCYKISTQRVLRRIQFYAIQYLHFIKLHKRVGYFRSSTTVSYVVKVKQSHYRPEVPSRFQEVKVPRLCDNGPGWW